MMDDRKIRVLKSIKKEYGILKKTILVCLLALTSISLMACGRTRQGKNEEGQGAGNIPGPTISPTKEPSPTEEPEPTKEPESTEESKSSEQVIQGTSALTQGNYLFYKTGTLAKSSITAKNLKTSEENEIAVIDYINYYSNYEFYLRGNVIYYHSEGGIYRVDADGENRERVFKGRAMILGFYEDDVFALDRKTKEIIRINEAGETKTLAKMKSIDSLEAVMVQDGIYYISKSSNNDLDENDPTDRLYYIDFNGENKEEVYADTDIYDLKTGKSEVFFLTISEEKESMKLVKAKGNETAVIHSMSKQELENQGYDWFGYHSFTLLGITDTYVYFGIDPVDIYSIGVDGKDYNLYLDGSQIEGINGSAYFSRGSVDEGYLKIIFDCDEDPVEIYLINLKDKSMIKFDGAYYKSTTIDVNGESVYYSKSSEYHREDEPPEEYEYGQSAISQLK